MSDKRDLSKAPGATPPADAAGGRSMVEAFLGQAKRLGPVTQAGPRPRLVFALDATMSRQPTWDLACQVQGEMFDAAAGIGGLSVQLVYFRGFGECRSSGWVVQPRALTGLMTGIHCRGGQTQIGRVLRHVREEAGDSPVKAVIYVGDAMEEAVDDLCAVAGELGLLGVKAFMFQEGSDPVASQAFGEIARLTGGAFGRFDAAAPASLAALLRAAAAYASGGIGALERLAAGSQEARGLLTSMTGRAP